MKDIKNNAIGENAIPDFENVKNLAAIEDRFESSARAIMLDHELVFHDKAFNITSLELYLKLHNQKTIWYDPATDDDAIEQYNSGTWYIMQKKGPAYCRIDITAGNKINEVQAGLLIRELDGFRGPSKALQGIVRGNFGRHSWTNEERTLIDSIHGKRIDGGDGSPLILRRRTQSLMLPLGKGKRINLPKNKYGSFEGHSTRDANLRVAIRGKYSADKLIDDN